MLDPHTPPDERVTPSPPGRLGALPTDALVEALLQHFQNSSCSNFEINICWKMILILQTTLSEPDSSPESEPFEVDTTSRHDFTSSAGCGSNSFAFSSGLEELRV